MAKRPLNLTATELFDLRQALQLATLDALMDSRRWEPGDLLFQGGTSLNLAHGSPRFSEDLDFLVKSSLNLDAIGASIEARLSGTSWLPAGTKLSVSKAKEGRNPHTFLVTVGGPDVISSVRVKVEMWQAKGEVLAGMKAIVAPVRLVKGPAAGMQTFVPTAELKEIHADKVFALGARTRLKPRDVFDLHWLATNHKLSTTNAADMRVRLATYPNETPESWLEKALAHLADLRGAQALIQENLAQWLPSSWPLDDDSVYEMRQSATKALQSGIQVIRSLRDLERGRDGPAP